MKLDSLELNQIYCEDCLSFMKKIPSNSIDLVIADPPFGYTIVRNEWDYILNRKDYLRFSLQWMQEMVRIMNEKASAYIFSGIEYAAETRLFLTRPKYCNLKLLNWIIWKFDLGYHPKYHYKMRTNHIFFVSKTDNWIFNADQVRILVNPKDKRHNPNGQIPCDVWEFSEPRKNSKEYANHEAQKPLLMIERMVVASSNRGDLVFDPFIGSGTTAVVAKKLGRNFLGCDINQGYIDIANQRLMEIET